MRFRPGATYGELYGPVTTITDREEAKRYFDLLVEHCIDENARRGRTVTREEAERIERHNIGYWSGYYDDTTMKQIQEVFDVSHPILGSISIPEEAFKAGLKAGQKTKHK